MFELWWLIPVAIALLWAGRRWWRARRRARWLAQPVPAHWPRLLAEVWPPYRRLPRGIRERLHARIHVFLAEKNFEVFDGLALDEAMQLRIAAPACLLLEAGTSDFYPRLYSILIYPTAFVAETEHDVGDAVVVGDELRSGESWQTGTVILAWDDVCYDDPEGDVVLHEFAHQLDQEHAAVDGVPPLPPAVAPARWAAVMGAAYERHVRLSDRGRDDGLDPYGAESPAEFFAVVTETFWVRPGRLRRFDADLFALMVDFYGTDPLAWPAPAAGRR